MLEPAARGIRRGAGLWGPIAFAAASEAAAKRLPGYDARHQHVSGLAARHTRSAPIMIAGFVALGTAHLLMEHDEPAVRGLLRLAGVGTIAAGAFRCSTPDCPDPFTDPAATWSDAIHAAASIFTFVTWVALPAVDARRSPPGPYRDLCRYLAASTAVGFLLAGATTRLDSPAKGMAQRAFLGTAFAWHAACALIGERRNEHTRA